MSGRLIILSKKGYCPWKAENLARIRRDEKEYEESQEREREKYACMTSASRLALLKKNRNEQQRHFNLFESEEKASSVTTKQSKDPRREALGWGKGSIRSERRESNNEEKKSSNANQLYNQFGGTFVTDKGTANSFYLKARSIMEPLGNKEEQLKQEMDPMRDFYDAQKAISYRKTRQRERTNVVKSQTPHSHDCFSGRGDAGKKKRKIRHREDCKAHGHRRRSRLEKGKRSRHMYTSSDSTVFIKDLRKKRADREERESLRKEALFNEFGSSEAGNVIRKMAS